MYLQVNNQRLVSRSTMAVFVSMSAVVAAQYECRRGGPLVSLIFSVSAMRTLPIP